MPQQILSDLTSEESATYDVLLEELAEEAQNYVDLIQRLKTLPLDSDQRDDLEADLYGSIAHLAGHAAMLQEALEALAEAELREKA